MWTDTTYHANFDAVVGATLSGLSTAAQELLWFNEGQSRLNKYRPRTQDITWALADRSVNLASDFVSLQKLVTTSGNIAQPWRVFGQTLVLDDSDGASEAGGGRVYYWAEWPEMTAAVDSSLPLALDYACLYYAVSRFYKLLSSNRAYYKRYATQVGANAVSMSDLQQEADRYYQDFLDAREDHRPEPPAFFFES